MCILAFVLNYFIRIFIRFHFVCTFDSMLGVCTRTLTHKPIKANTRATTPTTKKLSHCKLNAIIVGTIVWLAQFSVWFELMQKMRKFSFRVKERKQNRKKRIYGIHATNHFKMLCWHLLLNDANEKKNCADGIKWQDFSIPFHYSLFSFFSLVPMFSVTFSI